MLKKALYTLLLSTISMMALETGESIPKKISEKLNMQADKVYVIDFFASWCKSCKKELPLVANVHNDKVAEVIGINVDKKKENGEALVKKLELPFHVIYDEDKLMIETFDPIGFPAIYYVKNDKVLHVIFGAVESIDEKITNDLKELK